jgi:hypothetical protein
MVALTTHFVGSIPLETADTVFRQVAGAVGPHLTRLPDGEIGKRRYWIRHLQFMLAEHPAFEVDPSVPPFKFTQWDGKVVREIKLVKFKDGVDPDKVVFDTGYAAAAKESFATFDNLQRAGVIPKGVKFQVCLPTPLATAYNCIAPRSRADYARSFGRHMLDEVAAIAAALPNDRIAIQWDVCQEVLAWEGYYGAQPPGERDEVIATLARLGDAVPEPIELGYHLCYGSPADEHMIQPEDSGVMVEITNRLLAAVRRTVQFMHLPVPKNRADDAYFAPLKNLKLKPETELLLGLVHYDDAAGDAARLAAARRHAKVAGIGTECGWGRADPARVPGFLSAHAALATKG